MTLGVEALLGRFVDAAYAYRFGPRGHDLVVASVRADGDEVPGLVHVRQLGPRPARRETTARLGLTGTLDALPDGALLATVRAEALAIGVRVEARGHVADDAWFTLPPGCEQRVLLRPVGDGAAQDGVPPAHVMAANAEGRVRLVERPAADAAGSSR